MKHFPGGELPEKLGRGVRLASQNPYAIYDQNGGKMAKIDTPCMTKTAEKPPFGAAHTYIAHIMEYAPPGAFTIGEGVH